MLNVCDLSTDGCFTFGAAVGAVVAVSGHPFLSIVAAMAAGVTSGFVTAILQTKLGVDSLLAGIIVNTALYSVNIAVMGGSSLINMNRTTTVFTMMKDALAGTPLKGREDILIAAISSAPLLLAKAGLLKDTKFTGGIWQNFFDYFEFLPRENFQPKVVVQDKKIITAIGFAHQEFARKVILSLGLSDYTDNYFKEQNEYAEEDLIFTLSDEEFDEVKRSIEKTL